MGAKWMSCIAGSGVLKSSRTIRLRSRSFAELVSFSEMDAEELVRPQRHFWVDVVITLRLTKALRVSFWRVWKGSKRTRAGKKDTNLEELAPRHLGGIDPQS